MSQDVSFYILDGNKTKDVIDGFKEMTWRYRCPQLIIADHTSQFVSLANNSNLLEELSEMKINCRILGAREAFASDFERNWKSVKKIVKSLMPGSESIYQPVHTISDLRRKLALASYLMSFRPIFQKNSDLYMYPRLFTHLHTDPIRITGDFLLVISK